MKENNYTVRVITDKKEVYLYDTVAFSKEEAVGKVAFAFKIEYPNETKTDIFCTTENGKKVK